MKKPNFKFPLQNKNQLQAKENIEITNKKEFKSSSKDDEWESF